MAAQSLAKSILGQYTVTGASVSNTFTIFIDGEKSPRGSPGGYLPMTRASILIEKSGDSNQ